MANRIPRNPRTDSQQKRAFHRLKGGGFGDGLTIVADSKGTYSVQCAAPLKATALGVGLDLADSGGLGVSAGRLGVNVDNLTIEIAGNALRVRDGAITTAKLGDGQVTTSKIGDGQVTLTKCAFSLPVVPSFADSEVPAGAIDGVNTIFTLAHVPAAGSLQLYQSGLRQLPGTHYTLSGSTVTFASPPPAGAILLADYRY